MAGWGWTGRAWMQVGWSEQGLYSGEAFPLPCSVKRTLQLGELAQSAAVVLSASPYLKKIEVGREKRKSLSATRKF